MAAKVASGNNKVFQNVRKEFVLTWFLRELLKKSLITSLSMSMDET